LSVPHSVFRPIYTYSEPNDLSFISTSTTPYAIPDSQNYQFKSGKEDYIVMGTKKDDRLIVGGDTHAYIYIIPLCAKPLYYNHPYHMKIRSIFSKIYSP
jgi:hypothetical protein